MLGLMVLMTAVSLAGMVCDEWETIPTKPIAVAVHFQFKASDILLIIPAFFLVVRLVYLVFPVQPEQQHEQKHEGQEEEEEEKEDPAVAGEQRLSTRISTRLSRLSQISSFLLNFVSADSNVSDAGAENPNQGFFYFVIGAGPTTNTRQRTLGSRHKLLSPHTPTQLPNFHSIFGSGYLVQN